jgi:predicted regulator of Ras-like GTPase activity (Roadblock/LC7/MglB family)
MRWLAAEVERLRALAVERPRGAERCRAALGELVAAIARRDGVDASFACHEGLLVARAGRGDCEALAAVAQRCVEAGGAAARAVLGEPEQVLLVGAMYKLALIVIGPFALGVLAPSGAPLGRLLASKG